MFAVQVWVAQQVVPPPQAAKLMSPAEVHAVVPVDPASDAQASPDMETLPPLSQTNEVPFTHTLLPQLAVWLTPLFVIMQVHVTVPPSLPALVLPSPPPAAASEPLPCVDGDDELDEQAAGETQTATETSATARETEMNDIEISRKANLTGWESQVSRARAF